MGTLSRSHSWEKSSIQVLSIVKSHMNFSHLLSLFYMAQIRGMCAASKKVVFDDLILKEQEDHEQQYISLPVETY